MRFNFNNNTLKIFAAAMLGVSAAQSALAQFDSQNVNLYKWFDLGDLGGSNGNDCWGYVSPSGREYALAGVNNKIVFIEVTDPANSTIIDSVSHTSSLWGDVKVYQDHAYVVNEAGGGIQIIDMSDIDNGNVSLIGSINAPSSSHNIAVDTTSGFLYTCGSNGGAATTIIYSLADPANPVQVGTWNAAYLHDAQPFTYTKGKNAGRQILFGSSTGNGLDIIDVTNKNNVQLLSRRGYANVSYSHQSWTEDGRYVFLNDELDSIPRTTVYDVLDLDNPVVIGEFSSGLGAIDHNLYVKNGFVFEANYKTGVRIFDVRDSKTNPTQVGYFDTYPGDNGSGFNGAWSCYPYFPSGTLLVSDIDRGLFVLDPSAAVGGSLAALVDIGVQIGTIVNGSVAELETSDNAYVQTLSGYGQTLADLHTLEFQVSAVTQVDQPGSLNITIESRTGEQAGTVLIKLKNFDTNQFETIGTYAIGSSDETVTISDIDATNRVSDVGRIELLIKHTVHVPFFDFNFESYFDLIEIEVN